MTIHIVETNLKVQALDENAAAVYLATLSENGRRAMLRCLDVVAGYLAGIDALGFPWGALRYQHVAAVRRELILEYSPATVNLTLSALRGVLKQAFLLGQMAADDYRKAIAVKGIKNHTLPAGRELSAGEIAAIMSVCEGDPRPAGVRDGALFALMYSAGLRRAEVVALNLSDYSEETGELIIRGKGNKERLGYLTNGAARAMRDWLMVRGDHPGALFFPIRKGGAIQLRCMTAQSVYKMLRRRGEEAGASAFTPHDLRRSFVSHLLAAGEDISIVSKMAGHADVSTTARYDRRGELAKKKAAELLHVPYKGR